MREVRKTDLITQYNQGMIILLIVIAVCSLIWWIIYRDFLLEVVYFIYAMIVFSVIAVPLWFYVHR